MFRDRVRALTAVIKRERNALKRIVTWAGGFLCDGRPADKRRKDRGG
jgi:hypothetical protein